MERVAKRLRPLGEREDVLAVIAPQLLYAAGDSIARRRATNGAIERPDEVDLLRSIRLARGDVREPRRQRGRVELARERAQRAPGVVGHAHLDAHLTVDEWTHCDRRPAREHR